MGRSKSVGSANSTFEKVSVVVVPVAVAARFSTTVVAFAETTKVSCSMPVPVTMNVLSRLAMDDMFVIDVLPEVVSPV